MCLRMSEPRGVNPDLTSVADQGDLCPWVSIPERSAPVASGPIGPFGSRANSSNQFLSGCWNGADMMDWRFGVNLLDSGEK